MKSPRNNASSPENERSLFGEILDWMLTPLMLLLPVALALTWLVAQSIAGRPFDRALERFMHAGGEPQRLAEARTMNGIVDTYVPVIPLVVELETAYVQPWVLGFRGSPYVTYHYQYLDVDPARRKSLGSP